MPNELQAQFDKLFPYLLAGMLLATIGVGVILLTPETSRSEPIVEVSHAAVSVSPVAQEDKRINLREASIQDLDKLDGIGPRLAEQIVALREQNLISSVTDLLKVKGISENLYSGIKDKLIWE
jgi:competence ComEA-like helix-hairpin-helix protein